MTDTGEALDWAEYEALEDFDSEDLATYDAPADGGYLKSMWRGRGFRNAAYGDSQAEDLVIAHGMVQSFVNAFTPDGLRYQIRFDPDCPTAGTDLKTRRIVLTPAPVADPSLTAEQAGEVLTGLAVHEIAHGRYGKDNLEAVTRVFPGNRPAARLSNLLSDVHDEGRFVGDYPGYTGIFDPVLDYVGAKGGRSTPSIDEPVNLAIAAVRYLGWSDWTPETTVERDWWMDWAARWQAEDSPKRHVDGIREALRHIVDTTTEPQPQPEPGEGGEGEGGEGEGGEGEGESQPSPSDGMSDAKLNQATRRADMGEAEHTSSCAGSHTVDQAAEDAGVFSDQLRTDADSIIEAAERLEPVAGNGGEKVDVCQSLTGLLNGATPASPNPAAARYIRNALLSSRTGHDAVESHHKQGRLDGRGLVRIGFGDPRVFEQRRAQSTGRYLIWVLGDCSASMSNHIRAEAEVMHSLAVASTGVPTVRMAVYGWSDPFRESLGAAAGVVKAWETGEDPNQILGMTGLTLNNTPDTPVLKWAHRAILKAKRGSEQPVIIMISDGEGWEEMEGAVEAARRAGIIVRGVSFGDGMSPEALASRYGRGNFVPYAGSIIETARGLAGMIAKLVNLGR